MAKRKLMTIEDLVRFCREQNFTKFSSKESGYKLAVQVPTTFEIDENVDEDHRGMLKLKFRIFHTGLNRNGSFVSEDAAKEAMPTIKNRPIMAAIHQLDNGEWDFESHNFEVVENEETGETETIYIEKQVGSFDESEPFFEYDKELDKTYICGYGYIPEEYTKAADIIRRKNGTKNSCELSIEELSFNAKESYLSLDKFYVAASTLLGSKKDGTEIGEGMLGSRADIADFSEQNNSMFSQNNNEELLSEIKKLNENLSRFNINTSLKEGGNAVTKFEELLNQYGKTVEDITFDYENLSDEELEAKFAEVFGDDDTDGEGADPEPASEGDEGNDDSGNEGTEPEGDEGNEGNPEPEGEPEGEQFSEKLIRTFEISHEDTRYALYNLLSSFEELDNEWYWISNVYDSYFVYENWEGTKIYRQEYTKDGDNVSFANERVELFKELLTASEKAELDSMRANYAAFETQLKEYQLKEETAQKDALFVSEDYSSISDKEEFKTLAENHAEFSVEELKSKLDAIILDYAKKGNLNFSANLEKKSIGMTKLPIQTSNNKKSRYGSLFSK